MPDFNGKFTDFNGKFVAVCLVPEKIKTGTGTGSLAVPSPTVPLDK